MFAVRHSTSHSFQVNVAVAVVVVVATVDIAANTVVVAIAVFSLCFVKFALSLCHTCCAPTDLSATAYICLTFVCTIYIHIIVILCTDWAHV